MATEVVFKRESAGQELGTILGYFQEIPWLFDFHVNNSLKMNCKTIASMIPSRLTKFRAFDVYSAVLLGLAMTETELKTCYRIR